MPVFCCGFDGSIGVCVLLSAQSNVFFVRMQKVQFMLCLGVSFGPGLRVQWIKNIEVQERS